MVCPVSVHPLFPCRLSTIDFEGNKFTRAVQTSVVHLILNNVHFCAKDMMTFESKFQGHANRLTPTSQTTELQTFNLRVCINTKHVRTQTTSNQCTSTTNQTKQAREQPPHTAAQAPHETPPPANLNS